MKSMPFGKIGDVIVESKNHKPWKNAVTFYSEELDETEPGKNLNKLFKAALLALHKEDVELKSLFDAASDHQYKDTSHGLAYWLYETTVVYLIFKAWIPLGKVTWEKRKSEKPTEHVDLEIKMESQTYRFEAKWWWNMHQDMMESIKYDIDRLKEDIIGSGYLITFWPSPQNWWENITDEQHSDLLSIVKLIKEMEKEKHHISLEYLGAFPTHLKDNSNNSYFAMAIFKVVKN